MDNFITNQELTINSINFVQEFTFSRIYKNTFLSFIYYCGFSFLLIITLKYDFEKTNFYQNYDAEHILMEKYSRELTASKVLESDKILTDIEKKGIIQFKV